MSNSYDELEDQIGDVGGEVPQSMGKLKHKASYGKKDDLSEEENARMEEFLERSKMRKEEKTNIQISQGWIPIDRNEMGKRSAYYPEEWEFYIRPATVQAIKNWTSIDEERPEVVNSVFNDIIKTCVKIDTKSQEGASWGQINSWDRFWFVLKVREYTYSNDQNKIEFIDECSNCNEDIEYNLTSDSLFYDYPDEELVDSYWNGNVWNIDPREYNVDHDIIKLYPPKLGKDEAIIEWATAKVRSKQKIDETFIKFLVWMLPKAQKDANMLDRTIQKLYKEYKSWDIDMFTFMNDVINNININTSEQLRVICPHCGQEATSTVQFPDGVKVLFEAQTNVKKFGSR